MGYDNKEVKFVELKPENCWWQVTVAWCGWRSAPDFGMGLKCLPPSLRYGTCVMSLPRAPYDLSLVASLDVLALNTSNLPISLHVSHDQCTCYEAGRDKPIAGHA